MRLRVAATAMSAICAALSAATVVFWALGAGPAPPSGWGTPGLQAILLLLPLTFAAVGTVVALRQPANRIGWVCLGIGLFLSIGNGAGPYSTYASDTGSAPLPGTDFFTWLNDWTWLPAIGDAQRTLEDFSSRLREQVDLDTLNAELSQVVRATLQPAHVSLWLRS
jgi:hypothetical protein